MKPVLLAIGLAIVAAGIESFILLPFLSLGPLLTLVARAGSFAAALFVGTPFLYAGFRMKNARGGRESEGLRP